MAARIAYIAGVAGGDVTTGENTAMANVRASNEAALSLDPPTSHTPHLSEASPGSGATSDGTVAEVSPNLVTAPASSPLRFPASRRTRRNPNTRQRAHGAGGDAVQRRSGRRGLASPTAAMRVAVTLVDMPTTR
jgi:hypothetical protein